MTNLCLSEPRARRLLLAVVVLLFALPIEAQSAVDGSWRTWTIDGVERTAWVHLPGESPIRSPVILAFHGHGGRAARMRRTMGLERHWADAVVVYPQGLPTKTLRDPEGTRAGWQNRTGESGDRDFAFVDEILESLRKDGWVDDARIYATGHSNGGGMTYALWRARPGLLAAVAPVAAGSLEVRRLTPLPCMHVAGRDDRIVPFANQERTMAEVRRINRCEAEGREWAEDCTRWESGLGAPFVAMIVDGGHEYPAAAPPLIVRFFREHARTRTDLRRRPDPATDGPWQHSVGVFRVGTDRTVTRLASFERAGVSSLALLESGEILAAFQWFPESGNGFDQIAVSRSTDHGEHWSEPRTIAITGLADDERPPFDPTLVALDDGRVRLYLTRNRMRGGPPSMPRIGSAISADGVSFETEAGDRLAVDGEAVIDCAVAKLGSTWHLVAPQATNSRRDAQVGRAYHAVSSDGLEFHRVADLELDGGARWLGALMEHEGALHFHGTSDHGLWHARSTDGEHWQVADESLAVPGADPGVVMMPNGALLVTATVMKPRR